MWSGFVQNILVALSVFLFTQLWTKKQDNQHVREALFDIKSEIVHNGVLINDAKQTLERMQSSRIGPGYTFVQGLQTQSVQRNLILIGQQNQKDSESLVKYYSDLDGLKIFGEEEVGDVGITDQEIQDSETRLNNLIARHDNFLINQDRIGTSYPSLLSQTERAVEITARNIDKMKRLRTKIQENIRKMLLSRLQLASSEQTVALASIAVIYADLDVRDDYLYKYMAYLLLAFLITAFIPAGKKSLLKRGAKLDSTAN